MPRLKWSLPFFPRALTGTASKQVKTTSDTIDFQCLSDFILVTSRMRTVWMQRGVFPLLITRSETHNGSADAANLCSLTEKSSRFNLIRDAGGGVELAPKAFRLD